MTYNLTTYGAPYRVPLARCRTVVCRGGQADVDELQALCGSYCGRLGFVVPPEERSDGEQAAGGPAGGGAGGQEAMVAAPVASAPSPETSTSGRTFEEASAEAALLRWGWRTLWLWRRAGPLGAKANSVRTSAGTARVCVGRGLACPVHTGFVVCAGEGGWDERQTCGTPCARVRQGSAARQPCATPHHGHTVGQKSCAEYRTDF